MADQDSAQERATDSARPKAAPSSYISPLKGQGTQQPDGRPHLKDPRESEREGHEPRSRYNWQLTQSRARAQIHHCPPPGLTKQLETKMWLWGLADTVFITFCISILRNFHITKAHTSSLCHAMTFQELTRVQNIIATEKRV